MPLEEGILRFAATLFSNTTLLIGSVWSAVSVRAKGLRQAALTLIGVLCGRFLFIRILSSSGVDAIGRCNISS
jgi:hypothetical protein